MIVFAAQDYYKKILPLQLKTGGCEVGHFLNGEIYATINNPVIGRDCLIIGSIAPPAEQFLEVVMLASALNRSGAKTIQAFLPYLSYSRQDKLETFASAGIMTIGALLKTSGISKITSVDVHSELDKKILGLPLKSVSPASLFAPEIKKLGWEDAVVVAPDEGAIERANALALIAGYHNAVAHFTKERHDNIVHKSLVGEVGKRVILVDDILDSGQTLLSACKILHSKGTREIAIVVTHGIFQGQKWRLLFDLGVKKILVSDSCPEVAKINLPAVKVISLKPLVQQLEF